MEAAHHRSLPLPVRVPGVTNDDEESKGVGRDGQKLSLVYGIVSIAALIAAASKSCTHILRSQGWR